MEKETAPVQKKSAFEGVKNALSLLKIVLKYAGLIMVLVSVITFAVSEVEKWVSSNE